jgi:hypothetical protein
MTGEGVLPIHDGHGERMSAEEEDYVIPLLSRIRLKTLVNIFYNQSQSIKSKIKRYPINSCPFNPFPTKSLPSKYERILPRNINSSSTRKPTNHHSQRHQGIHTTNSLHESRMRRPPINNTPLDRILGIILPDISP